MRRKPDVNCQDLTPGGLKTILVVEDHPTNLQMTREILEIMGKKGGYIAAPTHDVASDVPVENLLAMIEAFGYPVPGM